MGIVNLEELPLIPIIIVIAVAIVAAGTIAALNRDKNGKTNDAGEGCLAPNFSSTPGNEKIRFMAGPTFEEELFAFYKECYSDEMDRKDEIRKQLGLAVAVLALLGNTIFYYFSDFQFSPFSPFRYLHLCFYVPFIVGVSLALSALVYLLRYFFLKEYIYIPTTEAIRDVINSFRKADQSGSEDAVRSFYMENLSGQYSECATHNRNNNTRRTGYVFSSLRSSLISILFLLLAFPAFFSFFKKESPSHNSKHVEVLTMGKQQASPDNPNKSDANASQDQQAQAPDSAEASPDIQWPEVERIKEADEKNAKSD